MCTRHDVHTAVRSRAGMGLERKEAGDGDVPEALMYYMNSVIGQVVR